MNENGECWTTVRDFGTKLVYRPAQHGSCEGDGDELGFRHNFSLLFFMSAPALEVVKIDPS